MPAFPPSGATGVPSCSSDLLDLVSGTSRLPRFPRSSVASQQFVDARLRAGCRGDPLDDHGTVKAVAAVGGGQRTADHHRTRWYPPVADLARHAVVDLRALADVHPHRDHGVLADDD